MSTPVTLRLFYYATALGVTAAVYLWTRSGDLQLLALLLLCLLVVPLLERFVMPEAAAASAREVADYKPSWRVVITGLLLFLAWAVVAVFLFPDFGLGPTFWLLLLLIPGIELFCWLGQRERRSMQSESFASH